MLQALRIITVGRKEISCQPHDRRNLTCSVPSLLLLLYLPLDWGFGRWVAASRGSGWLLSPADRGSSWEMVTVILPVQHVIATSASRSCVSFKSPTREGWSYWPHFTPKKERQWLFGAHSQQVAGTETCFFYSKVVGSPRRRRRGIKKEFRPPMICGAASNRPLKWTTDHGV